MKTENLDNAAYAARIKKRLKGLYNLSPVQGLSDSEIDEISFSRLPCQSCGSTLAGKRYKCTAQKGKQGKKVMLGERVILEICEDCYLYIFS